MAYAFSDQIRIAAHTVQRTGRGALKFALKSPLSRWIAGVPSAYHLLILPQDLRTGDPSFAAELYDGYFGLAGATAPIGSLSPFAIRPPTLAWQKELFAFAWVRHLHAADDEIAREKARGLVTDFIAQAKNTPAITHESDITARRAIALLSHASFLLEGADITFYEAAMRLLSRDLHNLTVIYGDAPGLPKLRSLTAILLAGLCVAEQQVYLSSYLSAFCSELDKQVLDDGGHISRDPSAVIELLLELLPLKQCFIARQIDPPDVLLNAIQKMQPMLRFLRLGDGRLAHFNGMGPTLVDQVSSVLAYDDTGAIFKGKIAPKAGYARLAAKKTVVIADCGAPPPLTMSARAHAGCGAFEMSVGHEPLITNCGTPLDDLSDWYVVSRSTAAHSTLTIDDLSSARLIKMQGLPGQREHYLLVGPRVVQCEEKGGETFLSVAINHDGYQDKFGLHHSRRLVLHKTTGNLEGHDQLLAAGDHMSSAARAAHFSIRFHLHPRVAADFLRNTKAINLTTPEGSVWRFSAEGAEIDMEESIFLADPICLRRSLQIVLKGPCSKPVSVKWSIENIEQTKMQPIDPRQRFKA